VEVPQPLDRIALTVDFTRDEHLEPLVAGFQSERASIERLVVDHAQGQSVLNDVRTAGRVPLDVCSFEPKKLLLYADIKAADCTSTLIFAQNLIAKSRVASGGIQTIRGIGYAVGDTDSGANIVVQRMGKVPVQELLGCFVDESVVGSQEIIEWFGETAHCLLLDECAAVQVTTRCSGQQTVLRNFPEFALPVVSQTAEGEFRVMRFTGWSEALQQTHQGLLQVLVASQPILVLNNPPEREQEQQGFVRRTLPVAPPHVEPVEYLEEFVAFHGETITGL